MDQIASMDLTIQVIRTVAIFGVALFFLVGLDLVLGGHLMALLGKIFNQRFDLDKIVLSGLSGLREGSEKKMMNIDEAMLKARSRMFMGVVLLIPAALLIVLVLTRR